MKLRFRLVKDWDWKKLVNLKNEMKFVVRPNKWDYKFVQAIWMNENYIKNLNNWDKKCSFVKNEI